MCFLWTNHTAFCFSHKASAGALKLQTSVLANEYANSKAALAFRLAQEQRLNISVDTWKSVSSQTAYACNVRLVDGTTALLGAQEVSSDAESAADVAGKSMLQLDLMSPGICSEILARQTV